MKCLALSSRQTGRRKGPRMRSDDEAISQFQPLFRFLAAFLSFACWGVCACGGVALGCRGIRKYSPAGLQALGTLEKEARHVR